MSDFKAALQKVTPKAIAWAEAQSELIIAHGVPLSVQGIADARTVGVSSPERIRIAFVSSLPLPGDEELCTIALHTGLLGPDMTGLTLGHGIFIVQGRQSRQLFTHEFRHVFQYEQAGSIAVFLSAYLDQIASVGYWDSPLELDARRHELT
jgi:hypothetical protein